MALWFDSNLGDRRAYAELEMLTLISESGESCKQWAVCELRSSLSLALSTAGLPVEDGELTIPSLAPSPRSATNLLSDYNITL